MKIWIFNHYAIPPSEAGGTRHYSLARELTRRGHEVSIVASAFAHLTRRSRISAHERVRIEDVDGIKFLWVPSPGYDANGISRLWNMLHFARASIRAAKEHLSGRPDVVIGSSPQLFAAWSAHRLAKKWDIPFIFEVRDIWPDSIVELSDISPQHPAIILLSWIERNLYRSAHRIIVLLPGALKHVEARGGKMERITWIPNGVDLSIAPPVTPPPQNVRPMLLYAGAHGVANDLDLVLDAAKLLQEQGYTDRLTIRLMGDGPKKQHLVQRAKREGLTVIEFLDPVPKSRIYSEIARADAGLLLLKQSPVFRWGVSPNKLFDYMASGRPVVFCVNSPHNPIDDARAGITCDQNAASLANAIKKILFAEPKELEDMGNRARSYVEANHDIIQLATKLDKTITEAKTEHGRLQQ